jgi:hypothetical protein
MNYPQLPRDQTRQGAIFTAKSPRLERYIENRADDPPVLQAITLNEIPLVRAHGRFSPASLRSVAVLFILAIHRSIAGW